MILRRYEDIEAEILLFIFRREIIENKKRKQNVFKAEERPVVGWLSVRGPGIINFVD